MRKIGIIGGMSWVSTSVYYDRINRLVQRRVPPPANAPLLIDSLDFEPLRRMAHAGNWDGVAEELAASARRLEGAGAQALLIAANSMHKVYDAVAAAVAIPILHIADCVAQRMSGADASPAAMLGTRNVMTEPFFRDRLTGRGIRLIDPNDDDISTLERIIYDELMVGRITRNAERALRSVITRRQQDGARAIVLACTELELIVDTDANVLPIFDSTDIHCRAAVDWMFADNS